MTECHVSGCDEVAVVPEFVPEGPDLVLRSYCLDHAGESA